jgi:hypothetical protein
MFKGVNAMDFAQRFPNNAACMRFLEEKKWKKGYSCLRCGCSSYMKGRTSYHRRCRQCDYDESVTANTIFHDMRLPIKKAFYMLFRIVTKKKGMSTVELAAEVGVQQKTAWLFKRKIQAALSGRAVENPDLAELLVFRKQSTNYLEKAAQKLEKLKAIRKQKQLEMINPDNVIFKNLGFKGKNVHAMLFKLWLRGIHHKCSKALFFAYCNEFYFRLRNRHNRHTIFDRSLANVLAATPHPYSLVKSSSA